MSREIDFHVRHMICGLACCSFCLDTVQVAQHDAQRLEVK